MNDFKHLVLSSFIARSSATLFLWTLTSFLCHQSAKYFLRNGNTYLPDQGLLLSLILTLVQVLTCFSLVDIQHQKDKLFYIMVVSHMVGTFATNCSMAFMSASSTFAIKLMEPITSAVVQRLVLSTSLSTSTLISLPLIVSGAVVFAGNPLATSSMSIGVLMALASNIILAVRNVTIKLGHKEPKQMNLRKAQYTSGVAVFFAGFTTIVYVFASREMLPKAATMITGMLFTSSFFHVAYSYVSTNIVLRYMTVVSHAVSNILKRLVVILLLYSFGHRQATAWNFAGLAVCTLGLLVYVNGKTAFIQERKSTTPIDSSKVISNPWKKTIIIFLSLMVFGALGIIGHTTDTFRNIPNHSVVNYIRDRVRPVSVHQSFDKHQSEALHFEDKSFGSNSFKLLDESEQIPNLNASYLAQNKQKIEEFLRWRLLDHKLETNLLAPLLRTNTEVIREIHRVHFNLFKDLIGKYKYAILFDIPLYENKGDPAITVGEVYLLRRLGIKVIFYCNCRHCMNAKLLDYVQKLSKRYSKDELVILFQGGGNLLGYTFNNDLRGKAFSRLKGFKMIIFSQSVFIRNHLYSGKEFEYCKTIYCCNPDLTIILRDKGSLEFALKYWNNGTNIILAPDMAFQIGLVHRFMSPSYDIMWLKRGDLESPPKYSVKTLMDKRNVTIESADWTKWSTKLGSTTMESAFLMANNGFVFLQRGRVVITDRLHGHILSTLLNIPHVLIDNQYKKLSTYHNTWTRSLENVLLTNDSSKALGLAMTLLEKYRDELPPIAPIMEAKEFDIKNPKTNV